MSTDPRRHLGRIGEGLAREHMERLGYSVLDANYRTRFGELDLVLSDGRTTVFCEVKTRRSTRPGSAWEGLHRAKRRQVRQIAMHWLTQRTERERTSELRFDAIGVVIDPCGRLVRLDHLEGAF